MRIAAANGWKDLLVGSAILVLAAVGCTSSGSEPASAPGTDPDLVLRVSGSGTTTSILQAIKAEFEADTPGVRLQVLPGTGTGGGVEGVIQELLEVAAMARPPKDGETARDIEYVELGQSPVVLYTNPSVGIDDLSTEQAVAVFTGQITNWSAVGGPNRLIVLYVRDEGDSSTTALRQAVFGEAVFAAGPDQVLRSQNQMMDTVAATPDSIGFGSWAAVVALGVDVRAVALNGASPDVDSYPIVSEVGIGYLSDRSEAVRPLIAWLLSDRGKEAMREVGVLVTE